MKWETITWHIAVYTSHSEPWLTSRSPFYLRSGSWLVPANGSAVVHPMNSWTCTAACLHTVTLASSVLMTSHLVKLKYKLASIFLIFRRNSSCFRSFFFPEFLYLSRSSFLNDSSSYFNILTRNSSGDEIANVNFLYDDIVHALQNTKDRA